MTTQRQAADADVQAIIRAAGDQDIWPDAPESADLPDQVPAFPPAGSFRPEAGQGLQDGEDDDSAPEVAHDLRAPQPMRQVRLRAAGQDHPAAQGRPAGPGYRPPGYPAPAGHPAAQGRPAGPGYPAAAGYPAPAGHPAAQGRPAGPGYPAAAGYPAPAGHPAAQGRPAGPGYPAAAGYPAPAGHPAAQGRPAGPGYPAAAGYPAPAGHPAAQGRPAGPGYPAAAGYPAPDPRSAVDTPGASKRRIGRRPGRGSAGQPQADGAAWPPGYGQPVAAGPVREAARPARRRRASRSKDDSAAGENRIPPPRHPRRQAKEYDSGLAVQAVHDNLVITDKDVTAWFVLPAEPWSFRPPAQRASVITAHAARMAQLVGRRCFIRVTSRPFPVRDWAVRLDRSIRERHPVMPGPCRRHPYRSDATCADCVPGHAWYDWLAAQQLRVHEWGTDNKVVYFGVELEGRAGLSKLLARASRHGASAELSGIAAKLPEVSAAVTGAGMRGTPATREQMQWLMARSCWLHMPAPRKVSDHPDAVPYALPGAVPATLSEAALAQFSEGTSWTAAPLARTVAITRSDGLTRHVAVLTIGEGWVGEDVPGDSPWLQRTDLLSFPVEWAVTVDVRDSKQVAGEMHRRIAEIKHQANHYAEHRMTMPAAMSRQFEDAQRLEDEAVYSPQAMVGRALVWARVAVSGGTEAEAIARAGQVAELYSPTIPVVHPPDQYRLAREFIPGEPLSSTAHCRRMPAVLLAAGMPNATARIGRRDGFPVGQTVSLSSRAVTMHPWRDMEERHKSGLTVVTGTLGSGKSNFAGLFAYMAVRAGIPTVIMDPSGLLDALCRMPELAPHSRAVNLLKSPPGTLNPYRLIADPRPEDFDLDDRGDPQDPDEAARLWEEACQAAAVSRQELTEEILRMLLPAEMRGSAEARAALSKAVTMIPPVVSASPRDVLDALRNVGDDYGVGHNGEWLADQLQKLTSHPWARLFFPPADDAADEGDVLSAGRLLTVMTLRGLVVPDPKTPPEQYDSAQRLSVPIMHLAAWLARRHVMDRPRHVRKLTIWDEAHQVTSGAIGKALLNVTARDSRKHNHCAILLSQLAQDLQIACVDDLIGMVMAGKTEGAEEQAATLSLLGLPSGQGYEGYLASLSREIPGQFMVKDGTGLEVIQVDLHGGGESLRAALDSTPTGQDPAGVQRPAVPAAASSGRPAAARMPLAGEVAS